MLEDQTLNTYVLSRSEIIGVFDKWRKEILEDKEDFDLGSIVEMNDYGQRAADTFLRLLNPISE